MKRGVKNKPKSENTHSGIVVKWYKFSITNDLFYPKKRQVYASIFCNEKTKEKKEKNGIYKPSYKVSHVFSHLSLASFVLIYLPEINKSVNRKLNSKQLIT